MSVGHKIIEPSGKTSVIAAEGREQIVDKVNAMIDKWGDYCDRNWLNNTGDVYTPELKIKYFLDSLAYFLLTGHTEGIETYYKKVMHAKTEIPVSSCPSEVDNLLYASGCMGDLIHEEEEAAFNNMLEYLDARAAPYECRKAVKEKRQTRFGRWMQMGAPCGEWCRVDTDGRFVFNNREYIISDQETQYQPIATEYGDYYAMDRVFAASGKFYDMGFNEISVIVTEM